MNYITILIVAIGLSFDTFAVSITTGLMANHIRFWQATKIALVFAFFQGLLPLLGWIVGMQVEGYIKDFDHWIAFGLLFFIGSKMILESLKPVEKRKEFNPFNPRILIGLAVSTSIDGLIVGVTFAFIDIDIALSVVIIGFITYIAAMLGMLFGKKAGEWFGKRMEIVGGLVLIGIGVKILIEHLAS
jgi:manganese efflux pump family protein